VLQSAGSVVVATLAVAAARADDTIMCGNSLVSVGMVAEQVVAKCGEPKDRSFSETPIRARLPNGTLAVVGVQQIEQWTYDRGQGRFPALLTFEDGKLQSIELLTRP
jgi:hypothetical protein